MTVIAPLKIGISFSKRKGKHRYFYLNLNQYRNEHFQVLNKAKVNFKEQMADQIRLLPVMTQIEITYILFPATKAKLDVSNVCSVVDKFFCDALVEFGKLPDDNYTHVPAINYRIGTIDKENPRILIKIRDLTTNTPITLAPIKENEMQITLSEEEILTAIDDFVRKQVNIADDQEISIELKAGRGENGYTATLDIRNRPIQSDSVRGSKATKADPIPSSTTATKSNATTKAVEKTEEVDAAPEKDEPVITDIFDEPKDPSSKAASIFGDID